MPVIGTHGIAGEDRVRDDGRVDTEVGEALASAPAVNDDPVEAREKPPPEPFFSRRPPGQEIVRREDRRHPGAEQ